MEASAQPCYGLVQTPIAENVGKFERAGLVLIAFACLYNATPPPKIVASDFGAAAPDPHPPRGLLRSKGLALTSGLKDLNRIAGQHLPIAWTSSRH